MSERQWERIGAGAGMVAVLLLLASGFVAPQPPHIDASVAKIARYVGDNSARLLASQVLAVLSVGVFLVFLGHLRHVLNRAEGGVESLSPIVLTSGTAVAAVGAMSALPMAVMAMMARQPEGLGSGPLIRMLFDTYMVAGGIASIAAAVFLASAGAAMVHKELVSQWLGYLSLVFGALMAIGGAAAMTNSSYDRGAMFVNYVGFLGFALVVFIASAAMLWRPEVDTDVDPDPVYVRAH
jgi:hypothetical protein